MEGKNKVTKTKQHYVAGFMFDEQDHDRVALIEKNKPIWQKGKLNAIGGKIEPDESAQYAMVREFLEETGLDTDWNTWNKFTQLEGEEFIVNFYVAVGPVNKLKSTTEEKVSVWNKSCITAQNAIPNLTWLLPLAQLALYGETPMLGVYEVPA